MVMAGVDADRRARIAADEREAERQYNDPVSVASRRLAALAPRVNPAELAEIEAALAQARAGSTDALADIDVWLGVTETLGPNN
jgi:hypothetical protein